MENKEKISLRTFTLDSLLHPLKTEPLKVGVLLAETSDRGSDTQTILTSLVNGCNQRRHDLIVAPEYSFFPCSGPLKESEVQAYLDTLKEAGRHNRTLVIPGTFVWQKEGKLFNTCFVLYQGEVIHEHHKNIDGGETGIASQYGLVAEWGTTDSLFGWEGLKLGIEICAESGLLWGSGIRNLDLLVLSSCGLDEDFLTASIKAVGDQGYGIIVDGLRPPYCNAAKVMRQKTAPHMQEVINYFTGKNKQ